MCRGDASVLDLKDRPLHVLQQIKNAVDSGMGQHIALVLSLGGSWVGQPAGSLRPHHQGGLSSTAPASSPYVAKRKGRGWFSCFHVPRAGSPTPEPPGPALLDCPDEMQGPLSLVRPT